MLGERREDKHGQYAYTWKDAKLGELKVLNTANAWWLNEQKLHDLIAAYKFYATDDQACYYAGINLGQLKYFQSLHPDFFAIKHAAKQDPNLRAKKTIVAEVEKNPDTAKWWLERTEKESFSSRVESTGANGRDLYDGLTQEIRELGEKVIHGGDDEKHAGESPAGDADAGSDGAGHAPEPAGDQPQG